MQLISLAQRAVPLIELMEYSLHDKVPVTWGVEAAGACAIPGMRILLVGMTR